MRPEHLEGLMRRLAANERILRMMVIPQLIDVLYEHIDPDTVANIEEIYLSLSTGKRIYSQQSLNDLQNRVNEALTKETKLPEDAQYQIKVCLDYLFPPPLPR